MKNIEDSEIAVMLEEADEDMFDARRLAGRSGPAARYSASQAAEKYLRALCDANDRPAGVMWNIGKVFDTVGDVEGIQTLGESVALLGRFTTPARMGDGQVVSMRDVLYAAELVRWTVRRALGTDEPEPEKPQPDDDQPSVESSESIDSAALPEIDDTIPTVLPRDATSSEPAVDDSPRTDVRTTETRAHTDVRSGRTDRERGTSFVKMFLVCERCGVRIPRTRQTAHGRVPCSMCGRPMKLQR